MTPAHAPAHRHEAGPQGGRELQGAHSAEKAGVGVPRFLQRRALQLDARHGPLEREADAVAEQIMRMPDGAVPAGIPGAAQSRAQDADRLSEQVMRMPEPQLQRACHCGGDCPECRTEHLGRAHETLQTKPVQPSASEQTEAPPIVHEVLSSPGQALDPATRRFMEPRFGHDFSQVRVHTDAKAAESARAVNALAYTVGHHVSFGAGQYAPDASGRRPLLAHELTHVVQQASLKPTPQMLRKEAVDVKGAAETIGIAVAEGPPRDEVDAFLESRRSLYQVALVGTNVHVTLSRSHEWTARYTNRALTEGAMGAAINVIYMGGATAAQARRAYEKVVGHGVKFTPATNQKHGEGAVHMTIIDDAAMTTIAEALNLTPKFMGEKWRAGFGEAKMIEFALDLAYDSFDKLVPHFSQKQLAASRMSVGLIHHLLEKRVQSMIEVAKRHPAAAPWREAYKRNLALHWAEREPVLEDFDKVPLSQWAKAVLEVATATRDALNEQIERKREEDRKHARNEHLRPHEIKVDNAAAFILEHFEPTHTERLHPNQWIVHGGQQLSNIKNEPIYLLRVESGRVIYQHLGNKRFYEQTLEGFSEEQLYSVYAAAGQKSQGAIALTKWVIGLAGAVFPPVRYGLMATDVLNAAFKLQTNRAELERNYDSVKLAYANIDALVPGVLPKIWDAVLDKRNVALFNPLQNPDAGAWLKAIIRLVMMRQARVVNASYVADAVNGFFAKAWAAIKKGLGALWEIVKHVIVVGSAVAGSTGVSGQRALDLAQQRFEELGVRQSLAIVGQIKRLSEADQQRLVREIQDLSTSGSKLMEVIKKSMSW